MAPKQNSPGVQEQTLASKGSESITLNFLVSLWNPSHHCRHHDFINPFILNLFNFQFVFSHT